MVNYILRRLVTAVFVLIVISIISFIVIQLPPGDFAQVYKQRLINQGGMKQQEAEQAAEVYRERYGLDKPLAIQYLNWIKGIVTEGKFGYSMAYARDVGGLIAERLPRTLLLALLVFTFRQEHVSSFFSPQYSLAPWSLAKIWDMIKHTWPVVLIAGLGGVARNMRVMRGNLLDVLNAQYVTTARAKGLRERAVMLKHAVPNALHPIIMYQGMVFPYIVQGELEAAIVMSIPTISPMFYDSLVNQDIYITGSILLMYGVMLVMGNLFADVALAALDPRIRYT